MRLIEKNSELLKGTLKFEILSIFYVPTVSRLSDFFIGCHHHVHNHVTIEINASVCDTSIE